MLMGGRGGSFPAPIPEPATPEKGKLTIGVIASVQAIYAREEQKQLQMKGQMQPAPLQPGWGGQGR